MQAKTSTILNQLCIVTRLYINESELNTPPARCALRETAADLP